MTLAPFGRVDGAANSEYPGAGLGLPLAKRFTELLGGEIEIESRLGQGTEITLRLPRNGRGRPTTSKRAAARGRVGGCVELARAHRFHSFPIELAHKNVLLRCNKSVAFWRNCCYISAP